MHTVRLLPFGNDTGAGNMARDDALLLTAAHRGVATLRFYTWDEPTLSLGYFQSARERLSCIPAWVRRSTGGAAIVHDPPHEITYSLALPPGNEWQPSGESWICRMHYMIRDVLKPWGVITNVVVCGEEHKRGSVLCFLHHTPGDLVVTGGKVAGSAQLKWKGALLQHGSILLGRSPFAPKLPGISELSGISVPVDRLASTMTERFTAVTSWAVTPGEWTAEELHSAGRIAAEKYASAEWNEKR